MKMTVNRRLAKSHGYYLQHAKEVCLVGKKGSDPPGTKNSVGSDIIYSERRGQSQKPEEIYQLVEELVPNGEYCWPQPQSLTAQVPCVPMFFSC